MSTPTTTNYLITGASRGIGQALAAAYLSRPHSTVIAAVRDPSHSTSKALSALPKDPSSTLIIVKIDSAAEADPAAAIKYLQSTHNITSLDVVIANAGICRDLPRVVEAKGASMQEHLLVNVIGPVRLFQAVLPLLEKSKMPKFVAMGSSGGSIGGMELRPFPSATYGASKAMLNYLTRKMHFEHEGVISFPIDPGWVQTDMGNDGARNLGIEKAEITLEESVGGLVAVIDGATREKTSGRFLLYTGEIAAW